MLNLKEAPSTVKVKKQDSKGIIILRCSIRGFFIVFCMQEVKLREK